MSEHKFVRSSPQHILSTQPGPPFGFEEGHELGDMSRVITGLEIRAEPGDIVSLTLLARQIDPETGKLIGSVRRYKADTPHQNSQPDEILEADSDQSVLGGFWIRAHPGDVTSLKIWHKSINEDGHLDHRDSKLKGIEPPRGFEVRREVPDGYVVVGVEVNAGPGHVTHMKGSYSTLRAN